MADADNIREDAYAHAEHLDSVINPTDRVYRNAATGRWIKVRVLRKPNPPGLGFGALVYAVSGAHCDKGGKALGHGEQGFQIAPAIMLTVQSDTPIDLELHLELHRRKACAQTERAVLIEEQAAAFAAAASA